MRLQTLFVVAIMIVFSGDAFTTAQDRDRGASIGPADFGSGDTPRRPSSFTRDGNQVDVKPIPGGGKHITVKESNRELEIVIRPSQISVSIRRNYGPDEIEKVIRRAPELEEALRTFPRTAGSKQVELSIGLKSTVTASDEAELRNKDVAAFNLFKKYQKASGSQMTRNRRFRGGFSTQRGNHIGPAMPSGIGDTIADGDDPSPVPESPDKKKKKRGGGSKIF